MLLLRFSVSAIVMDVSIERLMPFSGTCVTFISSSIVVSKTTTPLVTSLAYRQASHSTIITHSSSIYIKVSQTLQVSTDKLHAHLHWYIRMWVIPFYYYIFALEFVNTFYSSFPFKFWERTRISLELQFKRINMVLVYVRITELDYEFVGVGIGYMGYHVSEKGVGRDVEWDSEPQICRSLVHQT
jgi:hypothetical protein